MNAISPATMQMALIALVVFSCAGLLAAAFYPRFAKTKSAKRMEAIAGTKERGAARLVDEGRRSKKSVEDTLREMDEAAKAKLKKSQKPSLNIRIRQAGLHWSKRTYYLVCIAAGIASVIVAFTVFGAPLLPALGFGLAGGAALPHFYVNFTRKRRFAKFTREFPNAVDVIVRGVKAGLPLVDCLRIISMEAQEPVRSEFREIVDDQTLGMPLAEAVLQLPERIPLSEANFFAIVIAIQSKTGGSLSEALGNLSKVLRDRKMMGAKIKAMSQEAKASAGIIGSLPVIVTVLVYFTSPEYIMLLFTETTGNIVLAISGFWMLLGCLIMRKMINFDF